MLVENETPFPMHGHREHLVDFAMLFATAKVTLAVGPGNTLRYAAGQRPIATEGAELAPNGENPLLEEPSLTELLVGGSVMHADGSEFLAQDVRLRVGGFERTLRALGPRTWLGTPGALRPSDPQPTRSVSMSWTLAFGGKKRLPPGIFPGTNMPAPSTEVAYPANPEGRGFSVSEEEARGALLPQLERPDDLLVRWDQRPVPVCFSAMPLNSSLRMAHLRPQGDTLVSSFPEDTDPLSRTRLNASPDLQFGPLEVGTPVLLEGMGTPLSFQIPEPPVRWHVRAGRRARYFSVRLAAVQLFPNEGQIALLYRATLTAPLIQYETRTATLTLGEKWKAHS